MSTQPATPTPDGDLLRLEEVRAKVELLKAKKELRALEMESRLREGWYGSYTGDGFGDFVDPRDAYRDGDGYGGLLRAGGASPRDARRDGHNRPFVWTAIDLDFMREQARWIVTRNPIATGVVESLADYTAGTGYEYEPRPVKGHEKEQSVRGLARQVERVLEEFCSFDLSEEGDEEEIVWADREWDAVFQSVTDGEAGFRVFDQNDGGCLVRPVQPEQVRQPQGSAVNYLYGIETDPRDIERALNYAVHYDAGPDYEEVPGGEISWIKWNVPANVKRGLSDLYPGRDEFSNLHKLLRNMIITSGVQAAIAWIEQYEMAGVSALQTHLEAVRDQRGPRYPDPITGKVVERRKIEPGSTPMVGAGREYVPQPTAVNAPAHVTSAQAGMRMLGARWKMPEYVISGDTSNANLASLFVAGAPFVTRTKTRQQRFGRFFVRTLWRGPIRAAARAGRFRLNGRTLSYRDVSALISVAFTPPKVEIIDEAKQRNDDREDVKAELMSVPTYRTRRGLDDETEDKLIREHGQKKDGGKGDEAAALPGQQTQDAPQSEGEENAASSSVGGLQAILSLQTAVYKGDIPREAAVANAEVVFGFSPEEAARLFPEQKPEKTADDGQQQQGPPGGGAPSPLGAGPQPSPPDGAPPDDDGGGGLAALLGESRSLEESGFTGVKKDKLGHERHYVDGVQVAGSPEQTGAAPQRLGTSKERRTQRRAGGGGEAAAAPLAAQRQAGLQQLAQQHPPADPARADGILAKLAARAGAAAPKTAARLKQVSQVAATVAEKIESAPHAIDSFLGEVARERGLSEEQTKKARAVARVGSALAGAFAGAVGVNAPGGRDADDLVLDAIAAKVPVGSLAYLAYSAVRDPVAVYRAARNVVRRLRGGGPQQQPPAPAAAPPPAAGGQT